jgi:Domain of unknown function (DUF4349)
MSERRTDEISRELRARAPQAPDELRRSVHEIAAREEASTSSPRSVRRAALVAFACLVVVTAAAALTRNGGDEPQSSAPAERGQAAGKAVQGTRATAERASSYELRKPLDRATLPPAERPQDYRTSISLRVNDADDLSAKAQRAMRETRRMGGFVASVDFATEGDEGEAMLVLRVPVGRIQEAVARFSALGTIVAQRVSIDDLRPQADRLATTIARLRTQIAALETKARRSGLTASERRRLDLAREQLRTASERRAATLRRASYATVALTLTTADSRKREEPGAFRTFWDDAKQILTTELIWLLYALVVAGPFVLLALLAALAERARRRRANDALLAHH